MATIIPQLSYLNNLQKKLLEINVINGLNAVLRYTAHPYCTAPKGQ